MSSAGRNFGIPRDELNPVEVRRWAGWEEDIQHSWPGAGLPDFLAAPFDEIAVDVDIPSAGGFAEEYS